MAAGLLVLLDSLAEIYPILGGKMSSQRIQESHHIPHMIGEGHPYRCSGRLSHGCARFCLVSL